MKLHDYQIKAARFVVDTPRCALWLDMGLGKTISTLTAIALLKQKDPGLKVLVVAPKKVAETVWQEEVERWNLPLKCRKVLGDAQERKVAALDHSVDIHIINKENLIWLATSEKAIPWIWDMVVIDESSMLKNPATKSFKVLKRLSKYLKRVVLLTATPAPNSYMDLWGQFYMVDPELLTSTLTAYRFAYFSPGKRQGPIVYEWKIRPGSAEIIERRIKPYTLRLDAHDYLNMPERIDNFIPVALPSVALKAYKQFEKDRFVGLGGEIITPTNAAVLAGMLAQYANGFLYRSDEEGTVDEIHRSKLDALDDIVEHAQGPVLLFIHFKADKKRILARFEDARFLDGPKDIEDWNNRKIKLALAHPASAGHGLNLQHGGNIIVWFGMPWSLEQYQQANGRLYRQGQRETVVIHHLIAKGTIDERIARVINDKDLSQSGLLAAVKEI